MRLRTRHVCETVSICSITVKSFKYFHYRDKRTPLGRFLPSRMAFCACICACFWFLPPLFSSQMAPLNRHRHFVGWMKGDERQTSLFVCLTVGLTWVDLSRPCTRRAEPKTRERQREKNSGWTWREKGGGGILDEPALFFFSFSFKKKKHLFLVSRLLSF